MGLTGLTAGSCHRSAGGARIMGLHPPDVVVGGSTRGGAVPGRMPSSEMGLLLANGVHSGRFLKTGILGDPKIRGIQRKRHNKEISGWIGPDRIFSVVKKNPG